ncbi:MAG: branched-chain amino acid transaminase [Candidatus Rokuibacteriota bacterium]
MWMDGEFVGWEDASVHAMSHALHYGTAVFEGVRCYATADGPAVFRLREHLERFARSASFLFMGMPWTVGDLEEACHETVRRNGFKDCYLRPLAFYGAGPMNFTFKGNQVRVFVAAWPWGAYMGDGLRNGIRVKTVSWRKTPTNSMPSTAKLSGNYVNSCLAFQEAMRAGFDEALLLNDNGSVAEGSGENVFMVESGRVTTPPVSDNILAGITRESVMTIAKELGYGVREASLTRAELISADEVFMTGTAAEVTPVREIDWQPVGSGKPGEVTQKVQSTFFAAVRGELPEYAHWLSYVDKKDEAAGSQARPAEPARQAASQPHRSGGGP